MALDIRKTGELSQNTGMSQNELRLLWVEPRDVLVIQIDGAADFKHCAPGLWLAFLECAAFVNWRRTGRGGKPILSVSAYA